MFFSFKEVVHPKIKLLLSFIHPQVFENMNFFQLLNTKEDILKNAGKHWRKPLTYIVWKKYYGSQWLPATIC